MAIVTLPSTLARLAADQHEVEVDGATAGEVLRRLEERHGRLRGWILDERGRLRTHVSVFVNDRAGSLDSPVSPERLYCQFHGGVYRSDDRGVSWTDLSSGGGLPADFGFPVVVDPRDPDRAWVIPLVADVDRVTPEGRLRVYETRDAGSTWQARHRGLPQEGAYLTVLRQAFCHDGGGAGTGSLGLAFGTTTGEVFASPDAGETWMCAARHLPPVTSVRAAR